MTERPRVSSLRAGRGPASSSLGRAAPKLRVLDLFSGIGGFSLGLERTGGFETVAFCEIEQFPRKVLAKHWPGVPIYEDVRTLTGDTLARDGIAVDVITGGFPCQDLSVAGKRAGLNGERSGLWSEIVRLIGELSPRYVIVENVANLLSGPSEKRGGWFGRVLGDLAECGYDASWNVISAFECGAPHVRRRVWVVAHPQRLGSSGPWACWPSVHSEARRYREAKRLVHAFRKGTLPFVCRGHDGVSEELDGGLSGGEKRRSNPQLPALRSVIDAEEVFDGSIGGQGQVSKAIVLRQEVSSRSAGETECDPQANDDVTRQKAQKNLLRELREKITTARSPLGCGHNEQRPVKPNDTLRSLSQQGSRGADRIAALGNAVVPQIPELIGHAILQAETAQ